MSSLGAGRSLSRRGRSSVLLMALLLDVVAPIQALPAYHDCDRSWGADDDRSAVVAIRDQAWRRTRDGGTMVERTG